MGIVQRERIMCRISNIKKTIRISLFLSRSHTRHHHYYPYKYNIMITRIYLSIYINLSMYIYIPVYIQCIWSKYSFDDLSKMRDIYYISTKKQYFRITKNWKRCHVDRYIYKLTFIFGNGSLFLIFYMY